MNRRGSALVMTLFVLVLLTGTGVALLTLTRSEIAMGRADVRSKQAFYLAEAGLEAGRMDLFETVAGGSFDAALADAAHDAKFDLDPAALLPTYDSHGKPKSVGGHGDDVPLRGLTQFGETSGVAGWYATFLTNDPAEYASTHDTNERVMITAVGIGPDRSREVVQAIVEYRQLIPPAPPATITMLGPDPVFNGGTSASKDYYGTDCAGEGEPGLAVPTVGVFGTEAEMEARNGLGKGTTYQSGGYSGESTIVDLTNAGNPLVASEVDPTWTDCAALRAFMYTLRAEADVVCTSGSCKLPLSAPDRVVFAEGNYAPPDGEKGILAVTGTLSVKGGWSWDGLVLVVGTGVVVRSGGGTGEVQGGIVIANIAGADGELFTEDDCSAVPDGYGHAVFDTSGGGTSLISYCREVLQAAKVPLPYRVVGFLQR